VAVGHIHHISLNKGRRREGEFDHISVMHGHSQYLYQRKYK